MIDLDLLDAAIGGAATNMSFMFWLLRPILPGGACFRRITVHGGTCLCHGDLALELDDRADLLGAQTKPRLTETLDHQPPVFNKLPWQVTVISGESIISRSPLAMTARPHAGSTLGSSSGMLIHLIGAIFQLHPKETLENASLPRVRRNAAQMTGHGPTRQIWRDRLRTVCNYNHSRSLVQLFFRWKHVHENDGVII